MLLHFFSSSMVGTASIILFGEITHHVPEVKIYLFPCTARPGRKMDPKTGTTNSPDFPSCCWLKPKLLVGFFLSLFPGPFFPQPNLGRYFLSHFLVVILGKGKPPKSDPNQRNETRPQIIG